MTGQKIERRDTMNTKILKGSIELGNKIRGRRNELSLTIEELRKSWSWYQDME